MKHYGWPNREVRKAIEQHMIEHHENNLVVLNTDHDFRNRCRAIMNDVFVSAKEDAIQNVADEIVYCRSGTRFAGDLWNNM